MTSTPFPRGVLPAAAACLTLALSACGSSAAGSSAAAATSSAAAAAASTSAVPDTPVGPGCSAVPIAGMAADPVVTAAGHDPELATLVAAVTRAHLTDSLDSRQGITVFAPTDPAFQAVPPGVLKGLLADTAKLTQVLTHHVVEGRLRPAQLVGRHTTLNNDTVTITGTDGVLSVSADQTVAGAKPAAVICGNVQTANATIYLVDEVLKPAS